MAGEHDAGFRVVSADSDVTIAEIFKAQNTVGFAFTAGTFRRGANGRAIAESLNGGGLLYREMDSDDPLDSWSDGSEFSGDGLGGVIVAGERGAFASDGSRRSLRVVQ